MNILLLCLFSLGKLEASISDGTQNGAILGFKGHSGSELKVPLVGDGGYPSVDVGFEAKPKDLILRSNNECDRGTAFNKMIEKYSLRESYWGILPLYDSEKFIYGYSDKKILARFIIVALYEQNKVSSLKDSDILLNKALSILIKEIPDDSVNKRGICMAIERNSKKREKIEKKQLLIQ